MEVLFIYATINKLQRKRYLKEMYLVWICTNSAPALDQYSSDIEFFLRTMTSRCVVCIIKYPFMSDYLTPYTAGKIIKNHIKSKNGGHCQHIKTNPDYDKARISYISLFNKW